jgi:predicted O-linked N-acetylglucosamine transferase (SPINDLY family)
MPLADPHLFEQALQAHRAGRMTEAELIYRQVLVGDPQHAQALFQLGTLYCQVQNWAVAADVLTRAANIQPDHPDAWNNLGTALRNSGRATEAVAAYLRALQARETAITHENLASLLLALREPQQAASHAQRSVQLDENRAVSHCFLALSLAELGRYAEALPAAQRAVALDPNFIDAHSALSEMLRTLGDPTGAEREARAAIALNPALLPPRLLLGQALWKQNRLPEAAAEFERVVQMDPANPAAQAGLAGVCHAQARLTESVNHARRAIELDPGNFRVLNTLGNTLRNQGRLTEALAVYRRALEIFPNYLAVHDNLLAALHFDADHSPEQILQEHLAWSERHELPLIPAHVQHANTRDPARRLRVGYVSPNFCDHAIGRMLLPVVQAHDHQQIEVIFYSDCVRADGMTLQFKACADAWHETAALTHDQLATRIREDRIDILVDLTVHLAGSRLLAFARQPAPIQVTHMGYPATTGMRSIQYRITDIHLDPIGKTEAFNTEELIRLPHSFWCFAREDNLPPCGEPPVTQAGHITFGSLNNPSKVMRQTAELWSRVLHAVPNSTLMLLVYDYSGVNEYFYELFEEFGIPRERQIQVRQRPRPQYLELYQQIDIVLETMPYNGHNTSCDALLMGVPVITLPGVTSVSRAGLSFLRNIGLDELVATSADDFIRIASELATDLSRLKMLRAELRDRLLSSPLFDGRDHAAALEQAYRTMWTRLCASQ